MAKALACTPWDEVAGIITAAGIVVAIIWWVLYEFIKRMDEVDSYR
jgi:hypothetical protein